MTDTPATKPTKLTVVDFLAECDLAKDTSFSTVDLTGAMQSQAGLMARYVVLQSKCSRQVNDFELVLEAAESSVYRRLRDEMVANKEKPTDALLRQLVVSDKRILAIKRALNEARQIEQIAKGAVKAMEQRRDMLIQQGASEREERKGELRMNIAEEQRAQRERVLEGQKSLRGGSA